MEKENLIEAQQALIRKWQIESPGSGTREENTRESLLKALKERVLHLLNHNHEKLINALYRLDIPEQATHDAFALQKPEPIAEALSEAILKREIQKMQRRKQYREKLDSEAKSIE